MKSTVETLEPTKVKLVVEVPYEELETAMKAAYKEIGSQVNIPGFRKGHVPARVIDQRFGRGVVIEQVVNDVVPEYLSQGIIENELRPLAQPRIDVQSVPNTEGEPGGALVFEAEMDVVPDFDLPNLEGIEVTVPVIEVADEDVDAELLELRTRFASLKNLDRPAENGDFLTLDIAAEIDGQEIDRLSDVSYELGSASMLQGQDEALLGANAGDVINFKSEILGGDHAGTLADITAKVGAVKERILPDVDDDFAQMVSEFDTVEELREDTRKAVREGKRGQQALQARDLVLDSLLESTDIQLPQSVVDHEVAHRVGEEADEDAKTAASEAISKDIRQQILLDILAQEREVYVGQQELVDFMMSTARNFGLDINQMMADQNQVQNMYGELARTKALVSVLADAQVTDAEGNAVDLSEFTFDRAKAEAEAAQAAAQAAEQAQAAGDAGGEEFAISIDEDGEVQGD